MDIRFDRVGFVATVAGAAVVALAIAEYWPAPRSTLVPSTVRVVDGDTLAIRQAGAATRLRLFGIDAPELEQNCTDRQGALYPCGQRAAAYLLYLLARSTGLDCQRRDVDRYRRDVVQCFSSDGDRRLDLSAAMVAAGWALDYTRYSDGAYRPLERAARERGAGMWAGSFTPPWQWRAEHQ